jgi:glutamyl-tRNA synthetase
VDNSTLDDQVLVKSDGLPTYNFANVVDDHLMEISHVIRGSEYLSSTPKYNLLYQAFGWEIPHYVHCSQVMRDAQHKLSKRDGDASYADFVEKGYLMEAIINYIALLGWNPGTEREKFTLEELVEAFDLGGISRSPAIFDVHKLTWLNGQFIREMPLERFHEIALPWIRKAVKRQDIDLTKISRVLHERTEKFSDIPGQLDFIDALPDYSPELYVSKKMKTDPANSLESLKAILPMLESLPQWDHETLHREIFALIEKRGVKTGLILWPLRIALSGKQFTPGGGVELADALGREESLRRIRAGIELLEKKISC